MSTIAITGASGFLGRHLLSECILRGFKLRLLTRDRNAFRSLPSDTVTICEGDLLDRESIGSFLVPGCTIMHLAFLKNGGNANMVATSNLIDAAEQCGAKRIVHCSTAVVVGLNAGGIVNEETIPSPKGDYQLTKYRIEETLRAGLSPHVELAILRPTEIIGPGGLGLRTMIHRLRNERPYKNLIYHCVLKYRLFNYVSVYNVVAALILLATSPIPQPGEIYNISDDDDDDNNYAAVENIIASCLHLKGEYFIDIGLPRPALSLLFKLLPSLSPPNRVYSHAKITALGYRKAITLRSAISEIVSLETGKDDEVGVET